MNHRIPYYFLMVCALLSIYHVAESKNLETTRITTIKNTQKLAERLDSMTIQVSGKVSDSVGTILEGVVITERGTNNTVRTDENGTYSIRANPNGTLLILKSPYAKKDVHINNQKQIDIVLLVAPEQSPTAPASQTKVDTSTHDTTGLDTAQGKQTTAAPTHADTVPRTAQSTITGVVSDQSGPIGNATVQVMGTETKVATDEQGRYTIVADSSTTLTFSSVGYTTLEQLVGSRNDVNVVLAPEVTTIQSVTVVAVGYGTMDRKTLPTAVSSIGAKDIENEILPSISQAIQGKAGGVQVTQKSGSPGGGLSIRVRGTTSINASSDPLYVIDGIPVNSTTNFTGGSTFDFGGGTQGINVLSSLNPSDVQSIEILKDAASSSIYGSRAANGVVLITTRKGTAGDSQFSFNMYEGYSEVPRNRYYKMMNTEQYQDYMQDYYRYLIEADPTKTMPEQILSNSDINTNWQDAVFRTAPTRNYELGASGGSEKTQYYASLGYMRQGGVLHNSDFSRLSSRINLDHQHSEKLRFSTSVNLTRAINQRVQEENSKEGPTKGGIFSPPNLPVFDANGNYALDQVSATRENPLAILQLPTNEAETFRVLANVSAEYKILSSLALKTAFGTDISFIDETFFMPPTGLRSYTTQNGIGARRNTRDQLWINETTLTYDQTFGDHALNVLGGVSIQESKLEFVHAQRTNFPNDDIPYIVGGGTITGANSFPEEWAIASGFARVNYNFQGKYILNANLRTDGSSRFGADSRWATFPSMAAAWRISEEAFLKDSKTLNEMKIRASWGVTGNQNIGNYASRSLYSAGNNYLGMTGFVPNVLGDRNLKWETTRQWNVGMDLGLFGDRISLLADYYYKKTSDLLIGIPILLSSGYENRFTNAGDIENKGFEFELTSRNLTGAFQWTTSLNMTFNRNKVLALPEGIDDIRGGVGNVNRAVAGQPLGIFYGWKMIGVNPETGLIDFLGADGSAVAPTRVEDQVIIGDPNPNFFGGITNTFQYKNIDLSIMGQFSQGNDIFNYNLSTGLSGYNVSSNGLIDWVDRWRGPGDRTDVPRPTPGSFNNAEISDRFVEDGSFFRIRNITLGYTLPEGVSNRIRAKKLRWYLTVQNAFVFTKYRGFDPEVSSSHGGANTGLIYGYDYGSYPQPRIFTTGINLTF